MYVLMVVVGACSAGTTDAEHAKGPATVTTAKPAEVDVGKITLAEFNQIQPGQTYDQVVAIVGGPGKVTSTFTTPAIPGLAVMVLSTYQFDGGDFSSASVQFQDNVVSSKFQFGL